MLDKDIKQIYNNNITNVIQESKTSPDRERGKYPWAEGGGKDWLKFQSCLSDTSFPSIL